MMASAGGHWLKINKDTFTGRLFIPKDATVSTVVGKALANAENVGVTVKSAYALKDGDWGYITPSGDFLTANFDKTPLYEDHRTMAEKALSTLKIESEYPLLGVLNEGFVRFRTYNLGGERALDLEFTSLSKKIKSVLGDFLSIYPKTKVNYDLDDSESGSSTKSAMNDTSGFIKFFKIPTGG